MYINFNILMPILGCIVLVYCIITLFNLNRFIKNISKLLLNNHDNINKSLEDMPILTTNLINISENTKDVSEVVTDITADFIVKKESMKSNIDTITDILNIMKSVFGK